MKRGLVLVEGQTEERVVNECLAPYFLDRGLALTPTLLKTKRVVGGGDMRGGVSNYPRMRGDLVRLLHDHGAACITTVLDYYALPTDVPGMSTRPATSPRSRVEHVEAALAADVGDRRFVPHIVLHELEAWIYADAARLEPWMFDDDASIIEAIRDIAARHSSPEDIDDGPQTAPSKRLKAAFPAYQKTLHGPFALAAIGIDRIRAVCPHFDQWLRTLETLAAL